MKGKQNQNEEEEDGEGWGGGGGGGIGYVIWMKHKTEKCYKLLYSTLQKRSNVREDYFFYFVLIFSFFCCCCNSRKLSPRNVKNKQTGLGYLETWQHRPRYKEEEKTETAHYITLCDGNPCTHFCLSFGLPRSFELASEMKWSTWKIEK